MNTDVKVSLRAFVFSLSKLPRNSMSATVSENLVAVFVNFHNIFGFIFTFFVIVLSKFATALRIALVA